MTAPFYLSRSRLRRDISVATLLPLLLGENGGSGTEVQSSHRLVWSLFADGPDRRRDFLWREVDRGAFLLLSARPPDDRHSLFEIDEPKPFEPALKTGDRLRFSLRANPTVRRKRGPPHRHSARHDVVMDALPPAGHARAEQRLDAIREQGLVWLDRQADRAGFAVEAGDVSIDGYRQHRVRRKNGRDCMSFSTLDFDGVLEVQHPALFLSAITHGFGPAKAFGCGLMLIRRA